MNPPPVAGPLQEQVWRAAGTLRSFPERLTKVWGRWRVSGPGTQPASDTPSPVPVRRATTTELRSTRRLVEQPGVNYEFFFFNWVHSEMFTFILLSSDISHWKGCAHPRWKGRPEQCLHQLRHQPEDHHSHGSAFLLSWFGKQLATDLTQKFKMLCWIIIRSS